jgi:hypothetical protein
VALVKGNIVRKIFVTEYGLTPNGGRLRRELPKNRQLKLATNAQGKILCFPFKSQ